MISQIQTKLKILQKQNKFKTFFFNYYEKLNTCSDPFSTEKFNIFFSSQFLDKIPKISSNFDKKLLNSPIVLAELKNALSKLNKSSTGGPDGISAKLLAWFSGICPNLILKAINEQMLTGNSENKEVNNRNMIFIPKPSDQIDIKRYRPISLLNTLFRLGDICLTQRLTNIIEKFNIFSHNTYAYRKSFSIPDAILTLCSTIENIKCSKTKVCIIQTDIEAGFDSVSRSHIKQVLKILA